MAIPKIVTPEYETVLPSGKTVKYRPFVVKEEKILLMMKESTDFKTIVSVMLKVVESCVISKIDVPNMPYADLEHLFVSMRARSVGETVDINWTCKECGERFPASVSVSKITTTAPYPKDTKVMLDKNLGVIVAPIPAKHMGSIASNTEANPIEVLHYVIESVFTDEGIHKFSDYDLKERVEFVESLSMEHVKNILEMVEMFPKSCIRETLICPHCGAEQEVVVEGLENFFT